MVMEIWRKIQITAGVFAAVAVGLTVMAFYLPSAVYWAMWLWSFTLWLLMFLGPMPVIERNKSKSKFTRELSFFVAVFIAISINTWLEELWPATHGFSRGVLVYSVTYLVTAYVFAGWLKLKENKENK